MSRTLRFVVAGAYVADCLVSTPDVPLWGSVQQAHSIRTSPGGKALNQAVVLARLGAEAIALGVIGNDPLGNNILDTLHQEKVDTKGIQVQSEGGTRLCICFIGEDGKKSLVGSIAEDAETTKKAVWAAKDAIQQADAVLITFEIPIPAIADIITIAHEYGTRIILQPAPIITNIDRDCLPWEKIDVLVPNEAEARALLARHYQFDVLPTDELARTLAQVLGIPEVVVTRGAAGCIAHLAGVDTIGQPTKAAEIVDSIGASDAFTATLAFHLVNETPKQQAIQEALSAASWAVSHSGGYESMPQRNLINA